MYALGTLILYGTLGVCRVGEMVTRRVDGAEKQFYELQPLYQTCVVYAPVEGKVFTRPIITREEAERLIATIPSIRPKICPIKAAGQLADYYERAISTHDCGELIELTMSIYAKKRLAERQKRKMGAVDERFMKRAEDLLFGELGAALEIPRDNVRGYIEEKLGKAV